MRRSLLSALAALLAVSVHAATSPLKLLVQDRETQRPIAGAQATIGSFSGLSDESGLVQASLPHGSYQLRVAASGYRVFKTSVKLEGSRQLVVLMRPDGSPPAQDATTKTERFDRDPGWDGRNNVNDAIEPREIKQNFGYSPTAHAGGRPGEIGGRITPAGEPAFYASALKELTLDDELSASGRVSLGPDEAGGNTLLGFFNAESVNEWRTPNSIVLRLYGRGDKIHVQAEYATGKWRAGAQAFTNGGREAFLFPAAGPHFWSLRYEPKDGGRITATFDGKSVVVPFDAGHQADGARFNRFGLLNVVKSADGPGNVWVDDLTVNGEAFDFSTDPGWDGRRNRETYSSPEVRFRFDFGWRPTSHAGGGRGELGGLIYRGDDRSAGTLAYYGDRLQTLTLASPFRASGRVVLKRGQTDSGVHLGFFNAEESMRVSERNVGSIPENFAGISIEGPSREGFLPYPCYGTDKDGQARCAQGDERPHLYPDGKPHQWTLEYSPEGGGRLTATLDGQSSSLSLESGHQALGASFDRFGIITTHVDGNGQEIYFDDLTYTVK